MKKMIATFILTSALMTLNAQTVNDAKKLYYYERYKSANEMLKRVLAGNADDGFAWYWQARTLFALNDITGVRDLLAKAPSSIIESPFLKVVKGHLLLENKDTIGAKKYFEEAIGNARKKDPAIELAVAESNIEADNGNLYYAIALLEEAAKKDKKNPEIYTTLGDANRKILDGSSAFAAYSKAIDIDKNDALAYYKLGKIFQSQANKDMFLMYYNKALEIDPKFAPVYYQLYYNFYSYDTALAKQNLDLYIANADRSIKNDYLLADWLYVSKKYPDAIAEAKTIIQSEGTKTKPRIYKLIAYSYNEQKDFTNAGLFLNKYFKTDTDSNFAANDYELMAKIMEQSNQAAEAISWHEKAFDREKENSKKIDYINAISDYYKKNKDYVHEANWLGKAYSVKLNPNNVDLFKWGIAVYNAKEYKMADSVFAIYQDKYPQQTFGYYWRARSNAAIDTAMQWGIAIPYYEKLIDVAVKDTNNVTNRKWLIQAYSYIAAFDANTNKKYQEALNYYDKVLTLDPVNKDAERYKEILEKMIDNKQLK